MKKMDTLDSLLFQLEQYGEEHDRNKKHGKKNYGILLVRWGNFYQF